jgi:hypothetical protein
MPFHDARSTAGFRTPVQPKLGFVRAKYFANHSHSASFPRFYLLDQLFQSRRMKNPQPVAWLEKPVTTAGLHLALHSIL